MKHSESIAAIVPALLKAQQSIKQVAKERVGKVQSRTGGAYEYQYVNLADVIDAVKPALNDNGIVFVQAPGTPANGAVGALVTTTLFHSSGEWITEETWIPAALNSAQAIGSAITYAKRYALQSLTGLPADVDDDGDEASGGDTAKRMKDRANTATQVARDAFAELPEEEQTFLRDIAMNLIALHESAGDMVGYVEGQHLQTEERLALWSQLPSDLRAAYKKQARAREQEKAK